MASTIQVDKIQDTGGNTILSSNSTGTFTYEAASGANFTALDADNISAGTLAAARGGTGTTSYSPGITEFDQWRFDTTYVGAGGLISANWERNDNNFTKIGTGMSESSGIWTFPSTGIWFISFYITFSIESGSGQNYAGAKLYVTSNDATYATAAFGYCSPWQNGAWGTAYCNMGFDVTDVSQCKMKIYDDVSSATDLTRQASGTDNYNAATFIRLGDT